MKSRFFARAFFLLLAIIFLGCDDSTERLTGQIEITTETTGTFDPGVQYLITFSELVGIQDYPNGVMIGPNESSGTLAMPRVGEVLQIYISNVPSGCDITSSSSTGHQLQLIHSPSDPDHPQAQYGSGFVVPIDGSLGQLTFTITCP